MTTAAEYRRLAAWLRTRTHRDAAGLLDTDEINAFRLGAARAVIIIAAEKLDRGEPPADVAEWLRQEHAELNLSAADYAVLMIEREHERADEYAAKANALESTRPIRVRYLNGSVEAEDETHSITTTVGAFLAAEGERRDLTLADLAELEVGESLRIPGGGCTPETHLQTCVVERLADEVQGGEVVRAEGVALGGPHAHRVVEMQVERVEVEP